MALFLSPLKGHVKQLPHHKFDHTTGSCKAYCTTRGTTQVAVEAGQMHHVAVEAVDQVAVEAGQMLHQVAVEVGQMLVHQRKRRSAFY